MRSTVAADGVVVAASRCYRRAILDRNRSFVRSSDHSSDRSSSADDEAAVGIAD